MLVGVDFDNTIVCYDQLFYRVAMERGLIAPDVPASKGKVRDYLRQRGQEEVWTALQGYVYGARMQEAQPFPGVLEFFMRCKASGLTVCIVSHKTRHPFQGPTYDLHQAAHAWLESRGFYDPARIGLASWQVYFELTKQAKLARIAQLGCSHFIDDLPEFLSEPAFPAAVERILFDPNAEHVTTDLCYRAGSWSDIESTLVVARNGTP
jgi:hypothetical protein